MQQRRSPMQRSRGGTTRSRSAERTRTSTSRSQVSLRPKTNNVKKPNIDIPLLKCWQDDFFLSSLLVFLLSFSMWQYRLKVNYSMVCALYIFGQSRWCMSSFRTSTTTGLRNNRVMILRRGQRTFIKQGKPVYLYIHGQSNSN